MKTLVAFEELLSHFLVVSSSLAIGYCWDSREEASFSPCWATTIFPGYSALVAKLRATETACLELVKFPEG